MSYDYTLDELEQALLEHMEELGIPPAPGQQIIIDGRSHRYTVDGDRGNSNNGEYCVHLNDDPYGYAKSYKGDIYKGFRFYDGEKRRKKTTKEQEKEYREKRERELAARAREEEKKRARAVKDANGKWEAATPPKEGGRRHPYLKKKGLSGYYGAKVLGKELIIPVFDNFGKLISVQTIDAEGNKRFQAGAPVSGGRFVLGEAVPDAGGKSIVFLCEGFATGATVHEATGQRVYVCFDCGNMERVAESLRKDMYTGRIVVAADNDSGTEGNPGLAAAEKIREEWGFVYVYPEFKKNQKGTDWNDYALYNGIDATRDALREKLRAALSEPEPADRKIRWVNVTDKGKPKDTIGNLVCLLEYHGINVRYDEMRKEHKIELRPEEHKRISGGDNEQNAVYGHLQSLCSEYGLSDSHLEQYIISIAEASPFHPFLEWQSNITWDGVDRIPQLMATVQTDPGFDRAFMMTLFKRWLISVAAAASMRQGFFCRGVLVFQGPQAIGKTSWFRHLFPAEFSGWMSDGNTLNLSDKDSTKQCVSHLVVELGELESTFKKSDMDNLKNFTSRKEDELRMAWARKVSKFSRRTVFCASVNDKNFLRDTTGNSRWWVIPCDKIDYNHDVDMAQVWAQALALYRSGEIWWLTPDEERLLDRQNEQFEMVDGIEQELNRRYDWDVVRRGELDKCDWMTCAQVFRLLDDRGVPTAAQNKRVGQVLRKLTGMKDSKRHGKNSDRCFPIPPMLNEYTKNL